jgi:hypothetical protein
VEHETTAIEPQSWRNELVALDIKLEHADGVDMELEMVVLDITTKKLELEDMKHDTRMASCCRPKVCKR